MLPAPARDRRRTSGRADGRRGTNRPETPSQKVTGGALVRPIDALLQCTEQAVHSSSPLPAWASAAPPQPQSSAAAVPLPATRNHGQGCARANGSLFRPVLTLTCTLDALRRLCARLYLVARLSAVIAPSSPLAARVRPPPVQSRGRSGCSRSSRKARRASATARARTASRTARRCR